MQQQKGGSPPKIIVLEISHLPTRVRKVIALSNLVCRILIHRTSLLSYVIDLASLLLVDRVPRTNILLDLSLNQHTGKVLPTSVYGLVGQQHLKSHLKSGSSGRLPWSTRHKRKMQSITSIIKICISLKQENAVPNQGWHQLWGTKDNILRQSWICFLQLHF